MDAELLDHLTAGEAMHAGIVTCDVHAPLSAVARMMAGHHIHCVVVRNDAASWSETPGAGLWGVVSDLDLVRLVAADGVIGRTAGESAATPALTVRDRDSLREAAGVMSDNEITHLVVVNHAARPIGVLSTLDVARAVAELADGSPVVSAGRTGREER
ncbi:MAG TPA: CBS domain-containing protein [Gaiellaceae bacterium]|jgi:CBS domain-containing protein